MQVCLAALAYAESEPDPYLVYSGYSGFGYPYHHYGRFGYSGYHYSPYTTYRHFYKREAEAEPEADPYLVTPYAYTHHPFAYSHAYTHTYPYHFGYSHYNLAPKTYSNDAVSPHLYAAKGQYAAVNPGATHIAKREAEADPAVVYSSFYSHPFAYRSHYTPHVYGGYHNYGFPYRLWY